MEDNTPKSKGLIYGIYDRPPLSDTLFAAVQHLAWPSSWQSSPPP
jgi:hypothetical protein